jgi:S-(hydroxymethyl)glutathione dehydrogenase/alcohol dehydrogenase
VRAAVLWAPGEALTIEEVDTSALGDDEVRVMTRAVGLCHSDLHVIDGLLTRPTPIVLGHEAAGVVAEVGRGVAGIAVGDHVVACLVVHCGACRWCRRGRFALCAGRAATARSADQPSRLRRGSTPIHQFTNVGALAEEMILHRSGVVVVPETVPLEAAALLGCAVATGVGVVDRVAGVRRGDSVAVIGCGGVGLNIVQAARVAGASPIVAIDLDAQRRKRAVEEFGATDALDGGEPARVTTRVLEATGGGADHVFDAVGHVATTSLALELTANGGATYAVGIYPEGATVPVAVAHLHAAKRLIGVRMGDVDPGVDIPRLVRRYLDGELLLDQLITDRVGLDDVNEAFAALRAVEGTRTIVTFPPSGPAGPAEATR